MSGPAVLALLQTYARTSPDDAQVAMAEEVAAFVAAHPDCLLRSCAPGHLTGSAWIVDRERSRTLLTHHRKLGKWLQLGGHADGDPDLPGVAFREAVEESGLRGLTLVSRELFDVDIHEVPARPGEPAHLHYDFRFLVEADPDEPLSVSLESKALAWIPVSLMAHYNAEESMLRLARKTRSLAATRVEKR